MNYKLNLKNPKTFNEKLQWLKLYDRKPEYTKMVDKYEVRKYISEKIGEEYLVPLLGVWDNFDDIDFNLLPNQFVLKCTHDSGSVAICKDKEKFDFKIVKKKFSKALKRNYYYGKREWPYKNVKPRIIAEAFLDDNITDYKFHCFNGFARFAQVIFNRYIDKRNNMYILPEWKFTPINIDIDFKIGKKQINCPNNLTKMIKICKKLSYDIPYLRVDFYYINDKIFLGELTFSPVAGFIKSEPDMSHKWGSWITLPKNVEQKI